MKRLKFLLILVKSAVLYITIFNSEFPFQRPSTYHCLDVDHGLHTEKQWENIYGSVYINLQDFG
jgi:hypothetical protein